MYLVITIPRGVKYVYLVVVTIPRGVKYVYLVVVTIPTSFPIIAAQFIILSRRAFFSSSGSHSPFLRIFERN